MHLSKLNLNLLVALDALLQEKKVTLAAKRLKISQPQMSAILKQLREVFNDEIVVRQIGHKMCLTEKAQSLMPAVKKAVRDFNQIFNIQAAFDPEKTEMQFKIAFSDLTADFALSAILDKIKDIKKHISIETSSTYGLNTFDEFVSRKLDLAIGTYDIVSDKLSKEVLFKGEFVCVISKNHPLAKKGKITVKDLERYPLIGVRQSTSVWDDIFWNFNEAVSHKASFKAILTNFSSLLPTISKGEYICIVQKKLVSLYAEKHDLILTPVPFQTPEVSYCMYWEKINDNASHCLWLRNVVKSALE